MPRRGAPGGDSLGHRSLLALCGGELPGERNCPTEGMGLCGSKSSLQLIEANSWLFPPLLQRRLTVGPYAVLCMRFC